LARLRALLRWVSDIHLAATDVSLSRTEQLPPVAADFAEALAVAVGKPEQTPDEGELDELRKGLRPRSLEARLYSRLGRAAQAARRSEHEPEGHGLKLHDAPYPPLLQSLRSSLLAGSLIRPTALRMGITVALAGLAGLALGIDRFYWISITATAVLQAGNVVLTVNRSVQRALGTLIGVVIGALVLSAPLPLTATVPMAACFMGLTQLVVPRNFFYASICLTPMALILAHTADPNPVEQLAQARILDTVLGSVAGMAGAVLLWRRAAAARLPQTVVDVLDTTRTVLLAVLDPEVEPGPARTY
ncbi:FUSC family protein, partial [Streptomonospora algeriensis]